MLRLRSQFAAAPIREKERGVIASGPALADGQLTAWAQDLQHLQECLEARRRALLDTHKARRSHGENASSPMPIHDRIATAWREMCEEPHRRGYKACEGFWKTLKETDPQNDSVLGLRAVTGSDSAASLAERTAALDARLGELAERRRQWEALVEVKAESLGRELCADLHRSGYPACAHFLNATGEGEETARASITQAPLPSSESPTALRGGGAAAQRLSWSPVATWASARARSVVRGGVTTVSREQLRGKRWEGSPPKVACIAAVPQGSSSVRVKHFVNNFRLQSYEGERQLVLVYRHGDGEAARLVQEHADGETIKGVAAREQGDFPSTAALRYGVWGSDADVIVRWDLDAWHHPHRLSMQVRALAVAGRPACLLKRRALLDTGAEAPDGSAWAGSLAGETRWMRLHWRPLDDEELADLDGDRAGQVVRLDMPELAIYGDASADTPLSAH